jgi:hypothetical protein
MGISAGEGWNGGRVFGRETCHNDVAAHKMGYREMKPEILSEEENYGDFFEPSYPDL